MKKQKKRKYQKKKKKVNAEILLQESLATVEPEKKDHDKQDKKPHTSREKMGWFICVFLEAVIAICVGYFIAVLYKQFWAQPPHLEASENDLNGIIADYRVKVPGDTRVDSYLAFETGQTGQISIKLTNNDESTLVVNDIYLEVLDYQSSDDIIFLSGSWTGDYSAPVLYGVQLEDMCKKYKCMLLDKEGVEYFIAHQELPPEAGVKFMGEKISGNDTDEIEIIFSPLYSGKYQFKIIIDYTIRKFHRTIESKEFSFISLDPCSIPENSF